MGELLLRKALQVRDRIAKLRAATPSRAEDVLGDERLESFLAFNLFLLLQDAVDLASHLVAMRGLGIPSSQREVFELLARAGLISRESSEAMGQAAVLRNRIAHAYGDVDPVRLTRELPTGLAHVERFVDEVAEVIAAQGTK